MLAALILALLSQSDPLQPQGPIFSSPARMGGQGGLCGKLLPADKVGAWWCVDGAGKMAPGSAYGVAPQNSPSVATYEGFPQTVLNPTNVSQDQYFASATRAAPAGNVTVCALGTKAQATTVDWISFSDHGGTFNWLAEDNGTSITMFGLSSGQVAPSPPNFLESMVCLRYDASLKKGYICVFNSDPVGSGCNNVTVTNSSIPSGSLKWILAGAQSGTPYNMQGFFRGGFLTEAVIGDVELARIAAATEVKAPPYGWTMWQDATAIGSLGNTGFSHDSPVTTWISHGATQSFAAVSDAGTPHLNLVGEASVSFDGIYDQTTAPLSGHDLAFINQTSIFDVALLIRRRGTSVDGFERRIFGGSEGGAGLFLAFNGYGNTEGTFWTILGNGTGLRANYRSTLAAPLGAPYTLMVRSDGTNLKLSHDFVTFESTALVLASGGTDAGFNYSFGAVDPANTVGVQFMEGDVMQALVYPSNLSNPSLTALKSYLDFRAAGATTPKTWAALGDSITEGATANYPWPGHATQSMRPSIAVANQGKSGDTVAGITTRYTNAIHGQGYYGLNIMVGINDLAAGTSAATILAAINSLIATAKTDGLKVVVCTVSPNSGFSGWTAGMQTQWALLNAGIRALTGVVVFDTAFLADSIDPTKLNAAYDFGDGRHLNDTGTTAFSTAIVPVLRAL